MYRNFKLSRLLQPVDDIVFKDVLSLRVECLYFLFPRPCIESLRSNIAVVSTKQIKLILSHRNVVHMFCWLRHCKHACSTHHFDGCILWIVQYLSHLYLHVLLFILHDFMCCRFVILCFDIVFFFLLGIMFTLWHRGYEWRWLIYWLIRPSAKEKCRDRFCWLCYSCIESNLSKVGISAHSVLVFTSYFTIFPSTMFWFLSIFVCIF